MKQKVVTNFSYIITNDKSEDSTKSSSHIASVVNSLKNPERVFSCRKNFTRKSAKVQLPMKIIVLVGENML